MNVVNLAAVALDFFLIKIADEIIGGAGEIIAWATGILVTLSMSYYNYNRAISFKLDNKKKKLEVMEKEIELKRQKKILEEEFSE